MQATKRKHEGHPRTHAPCNKIESAMLAAIVSTPSNREQIRRPEQKGFTARAINAALSHHTVFHGKITSTT